MIRAVFAVLLRAGLGILTAVLFLVSVVFSSVVQSAVVVGKTLSDDLRRLRQQNADAEV